MRPLALVLCVLFVAGCSREPAGPSYADALKVLEAERAELADLQAKQDAVLAAAAADQQRLFDAYGS